jgi:hypothetical protein
VRKELKKRGWVERTCYHWLVQRGIRKKKHHGRSKDKSANNHLTVDWIKNDCGIDGFMVSWVGCEAVVWLCFDTSLVAVSTDYNLVGYFSYITSTISDHINCLTKIDQYLPVNIGCFWQKLEYLSPKYVCICYYR